MCSGYDRVDFDILVGRVRVCSAGTPVNRRNPKQLMKEEDVTRTFDTFDDGRVSEHCGGASSQFRYQGGRRAL